MSRQEKLHLIVFVYKITSPWYLSNPDMTNINIIVTPYGAIDLVNIGPTNEFT